MFELVQVGFARVPDYVDYCERWPQLVGTHGDLKDVQRPWALEFVKANVAPGGKILDLGGSRCELASALASEYDVKVVDPYDGSGGGPTNPDVLRVKHPNVDIQQGLVSKNTPYPGHDVVLSTSVVEHIDRRYHADTVEGIAGSLKPGGFSVHSIDVTCEGVGGFLESQIDLCSSWIAAHGVTHDMRATIDEMLNTIDTYFLPVTMYMLWKKKRRYAQYPWRKVGAVHFVARKL